MPVEVPESSLVANQGVTMPVRGRAVIPRRSVGALCAVLVAAGCVTDDAGTAGRPEMRTAESAQEQSGPGDGPTNATPSTSQGHFEPSVEVVEVIDGDTFVAIVDGERERVRLIGVDAPELGECLADDARSTLEGLLAGDVTLVGDVSDRDQYGRLLRYVFSDDVFVNRELVELGFALARFYPPDTSRQDELDSARRQAEADRAGLWSSTACGPATSFELVIAAINADAAGPDGENLNDEYVDLRNDGQESIPLTGWVVRDESASHRYGFPDGFVLGPGASVRLHTGCGQDSETSLYWCERGSAVWNNDGDTVFVLDPNGNLVASLAY